MATSQDRNYFLKLKFYLDLKKNRNTTWSILISNQFHDQSDQDSLSCHSSTWTSFSPIFQQFIFYNLMWETGGFKRFFKSNQPSLQENQNIRTYKVRCYRHLIKESCLASGPGSLVTSTNYSVKTSNCISQQYLKCFKA